MDFKTSKLQQDALVEQAFNILMSSGFSFNHKKDSLTVGHVLSQEASGASSTLIAAALLTDHYALTRKIDDTLPVNVRTLVYDYVAAYVDKKPGAAITPELKLMRAAAATAAVIRSAEVYDRKQSGLSYQFVTAAGKGALIRQAQEIDERLQHLKKEAITILQAVRDGGRVSGTFNHAAGGTAAVLDNFGAEVKLKSLFINSYNALATMLGQPTLKTSGGTTGNSGPGGGGSSGAAALSATVSTPEKTPEEQKKPKAPAPGAGH